MGIPVFYSSARRWLDLLTEFEGGRGNRKPGYLEWVLVSSHKSWPILIRSSTYGAGLGEGEGSPNGRYAFSFVWGQASVVEEEDMHTQDTSVIEEKQFIKTTRFPPVRP